MKTIRASRFTASWVVGLAAAALAGCGAEGAGTAQNDEGVIGGATGDALTSATVISDFGNVVRLEGRVAMFEGTTEIALFNRSRAVTKGMIHHVGGGQMGPSPFTTDVDIGDYTVPDDMLAEPGDCVSVANVGMGGRATGASLEEAEATREFGAFLYATTSLVDGAPVPAWAADVPRVFPSAAACLDAVRGL